MAARIIHVGADVCHRVGVLRSVGYLVDECRTIENLREALESKDQPDAVLIAEEKRRFLLQAFELLGKHTEIPLILFGEPNYSIGRAELDLVIPFLVPPEAWLSQIAAVVAHGQAIRIRRSVSGSYAAHTRRESKSKLTGNEPSTLTGKEPLTDGPLTKGT